jgi:hypothetical protein
LVSSAPTAHSGFVTACATLREHLLASHTTTEQVGQIATAAGVKTLVLSHFVPGATRSLTIVSGTTPCGPTSTEGWWWGAT